MTDRDRPRALPVAPFGAGLRPTGPMLDAIVKDLRKPLALKPPRKPVTR